MKERILVVEDDEAIAAFVQTALERAGFVVQVVGSGEETLAQVGRRPPDLIVLDLTLMGDMDGLDVCRRVRGYEQYIPIVMLTARDTDADKIVGLELGADDYITKPFNTRELIARVHAVLRLARRTGPSSGQDRLHIGDLVIDRACRTVTVAGQPVELTPKEFDLLAALAWKPGRVFGREMLLERVWGYDYMGESRTVDVHIQRLRHKVESDPANPRYLLTVHGVGYKFATEEDL
jgi:DNA-binding response OmpR family regulator